MISKYYGLENTSQVLETDLCLNILNGNVYNTIPYNDSTVAVDALNSPGTNLKFMDYNGKINSPMIGLGTEFISNINNPLRVDDQKTFTIGTNDFVANNNVQSTVKIARDSLPIFDTYLNFNIQPNLGPCLSTDNTFSAEFDTSAADVTLAMAINSDLNNDTGKSLLLVGEDINYNNNYSLAKNTTKFYTTDPSSNQIILHDLDHSNLISTNYVDVSVTPNKTVTNSSFGTFKINQLDSGVNTQTSTNTINLPFSMENNIPQTIPVLFSDYTVPVTVGSGATGISISSDKTKMALVNYTARKVQYATYDGAVWSALTDISGGPPNTIWISVALSNNGQRGVVTSRGGFTYFFTWTGSGYSALVQTLDTTARGGNGIDVTPDGTTIVLSAERVYYATWNGSNYTAFNITLDTVSASLQGAAISHDKSTIAYGANSNKFYWAKWNGTNYSTATSVTIPTGPVTNLKFNSDATVIFVLITSNTVTSVYYCTWNGSTYVNPTPVPSNAIPVGLTGWGLHISEDNSELYVSSEKQSSVFKTTLTFNINISNKLPNVMAKTDYDSLVANGTSDYSLKFQVVPVTNSGLSVSSQNLTYVRINNTSIVDNLSYMENVVNLTHEIEITQLPMTILNDSSYAETDYNMSHFHLTSTGETLDSNSFNVNGTIKLEFDQPNNRSVVDSSTGTFPSIVVDYNTFSDNLKTTKDVSYEVSNYLLPTGHGQCGAIANNNGTSLFMNVSDGAGLSITSNISGNDIALIKITTSNDLSAISNTSNQLFILDDVTNAPDVGINALVSISVINVDNNSFFTNDDLRFKVIPKTISDLNIGLSNPSWALSYNTNNYLESSSQVSTLVPSQMDMNDIILN